MSDHTYNAELERDERLQGIWRELVNQNGGDLRRAMRDLQKITDPMAEGDLETFREGLALLNIAGKELDKAEWFSHD